MNSIYKDPAKLVEAIGTLVRRFIPHMLPGHSFTLRAMCGDEFWLSLSKGQKSLAGTFMTQMVMNGDFELEFADTGVNQTKQYQRK